MTIWDARGHGGCWDGEGGLLRNICTIEFRGYFLAKNMY